MENVGNIKQGRKILGVEDDKYLVNALRVKLLKSGFQVQMAYDGIEALKVVPVFHPDLILLDLVMPRKDGFAVLEEIKKNSSWKNIPVIIISNLGQTEDITRGMQLGAVDYIVKSNTSMADIILKINKLLSPLGSEV